MSRAAIFSFMPVLTKILPESITNIERGRYYRCVGLRSEEHRRMVMLQEPVPRDHRQVDPGAQAGVQRQQVWGHPGRLPGQDQRRGGALLLRGHTQVML